MKLEQMIVADPMASVAELLADQCERLAEQCLVCTDGAAVIAAAKQRAPRMVMLSLEIQRPAALEVASELAKLEPRPFIVGMYRELGVPGMERYERIGVSDFVPQPVDVADVFRAASRHFGVPFRRHTRFAMRFDIARADGVLIGQTRDLSEGGMLMSTPHALTAGESLLVDLALPDGQDKPMRVRCSVLNVEGQAPAAMQANIQFVRLRGEEHRRLAQYLEKLGKARPHGGE